MPGLVGEPAEITVEDLEFDEKNTDHLAQHGVRPGDVQAVLRNAPQFFRNLARRSATHVMVGPDDGDRFFYVVLVQSQRPGVWRPLTAYRYARNRALRFYRGTDD